MTEAIDVAVEAGEELTRITGIGRRYAKLLEEAGVHSIQDLSRMDPLTLSDALLEINLLRGSTRNVPMETRVAGWVKQARELSDRT